MADKRNSEDARAAAATRRRWITFGEVLAVAAVLISAMTLWNSWQQREAEIADKTVTAAKADTAARTLLLKATAERDGERLALIPLGDDQSIQSQTLTFPSAMKLAPVDTTGDARIEASWFRSALVNARKAAKLEGATRGDARLPVLLTTRFLADGAELTDRAVYDLGYATSTGFLSGTAVHLRGLSLVSRVKGGGQARIDALWKTRLKT